ncbi:MAG: hypothetical protein M1833_006616 [Piccolia ochrophora]|nr:MAG: hypothetical protein M1833_006616 [Piccolia ochrophora]
MARRRSLLSPTLLLLCILVFTLFICSASAQVPAPPADDDKTTAVATDAENTPAPTEPASNSAEPTDAAATASNTDDAIPSAPESDSPSAPVTSDAAASSSDAGDRPTLSQGTTTTSDATATRPKSLPKLAGAFSYPPPTVPPTQKAPFMQQSTLPEGTVFIAVGGFLGFMGFAVLAWRGLIAWSIHRSVKRAAMQQNMADSKAMLRPPTFYSNGPGSTLSLDRLNGRTGGHSSKGHTPNSSLFFSPTARAGSVTATPGNRGSSYLPAGYYASGNSAPGGGNGMTHIGGGPQAHGYTRAHAAPSPPDSPSLPPSRGGETAYSRTVVPSHASTSSLNLAAAPQGRAPSAYLEDLFEGHETHGVSNRY